MFSPPPLFHPVKRLLQKFQVRGISGLFAAALNPLLFQRILRWSVILVKDAENAGEWELR